MITLWDASALIDVVTWRPGSDQLVEHVAEARISSVNWLEVQAWALTRRGVSDDAWRAAIQAAGLVVVPFALAHTEAGVLVRRVEARLRDGAPARRRRGLATADVACLATAIVEGWPVATSDQLAVRTARELEVEVVDYAVP